MKPIVEFEGVRAAQSARLSPRRQAALPGKQRGVVLFIALIALVAMMLAGIALVRSVDTGNVIAGNLSFKQSALQASDLGVEAALAALPAIVAAPDTDIAGKYFHVMQPVDAQGVIAGFSWSTAATPAAAVPGYDIRYVIERLCNGDSSAVLDLQASCYVDTADDGRTRGANKTSFIPVPVIYYRATVRVTGPRNSVSMVQSILSY